MVAPAGGSKADGHEGSKRSRSDVTSGSSPKLVTGSNSEKVRSVDEHEKTSAPRTDPAHQVRAELAAWSVDLAGLFTNNFALVGEEYAYKLDNGDSSNSLRLTKSEYEHYLASLKSFQNQPEKFVLNTGIETFDKGIEPVSLALAQAYLDLQKSDIVAAKDRKKIFRALVGRLTSKATKRDSKFGQHNDSNWQARMTRLIKFFRKTRTGLSANDSLHTVYTRDPKSLDRYEGPILVIFPDTHVGKDPDQQSQVDNMHGLQANVIAGLHDQGLATRMLQEGPTDTCVDATGVPSQDAGILLNTAMEKPLIAVTRYLSSRDNRPMTLESAESGNSKVFLESAFILNLLDLLQTSRPDQRIEKEVITLLEACEPEQRLKLAEDFNQSCRSVIKHLGLESIIELTEKDFSDLGIKLLFPQLKNKSEQRLHAAKILTLKNIINLQGILRNRYIVKKVKSGSKDSSIVLGAKHVVDLVLDESLSANPMPIYIAMFSKDIGKQGEIMELTSSRKQTLIAKMHYQLGSSVIGLLENNYIQLAI